MRGAGCGCLPQFQTAAPSSPHRPPRRRRWGISELGLSLVNHPHMPTLTRNEPNGPTIEWRVAQQRVPCLRPSPDAAPRLCT
ncbi:Os04g0290450 [Oryza sativa Japonica Group]|uniref:Os04g0290450 protein n=2 Tax=Oryza sativa subsp. japonica TaxID=39947 RepID=C7J0U0_ORYSJ|nr:hypothetical protein EE612_022871 [Oryza sativa]BAH92571.1 Os04g0290400 [Oryza sativa Japonica Group]BAS88413.1 Os04g0290450 [Oryza sativa Japonica Group]|eukprot:NP_001173843.1 Os04g0290400 [Oryza sativa Japonica Group]